MELKKTKESLAVYQQPLDIKLHHSFISTEEVCPFVSPENGLDALHDYAKWIVEANNEAGAENCTLIMELYH